MTLVKLSFPVLEWNPVRQSQGGESVWDDYVFRAEPGLMEADWWVVFEGLDQTRETLCSPDRTVFVTGEPPSVRSYNHKFLGQFAWVVSCQPAIRHPGLIRSIQGHPWFVKKSYDELMRLQPSVKTRLASLVTSFRQENEGHRRRIAFVRSLMEKYGDTIEVFGRGFREFDDKWDVMAPYKYTIVIENDSQPHWITEKLVDAYLCRALPLYHGAPNASEYFPRESFVPIDITRPSEAFDTISRTLATEDAWLNARKCIEEARHRCLTRFNFYALLRSIIAHRCINTAVRPCRRVVLRPESWFNQKPLPLRLAARTLRKSLTLARF